MPGALPKQIVKISKLMPAMMRWMIGKIPS